LLFVTVGCTDPTAGTPCPAGTLRCRCFANATCFAGLDCISGVCVQLSGGDPGGDGVTPADGGDDPGSDGAGPSDGNGDGNAGGDLGGDESSSGDGTGGGDASLAGCDSGEECRSGICDGGVCADAISCDAQATCAAGQYCHFPSAPNPWIPGTQGACSVPCSNNDSCGIIGQECHELASLRRCYTNLDCNPANNNADCPSGEVCWQTSRTCKWPPDQCYFPEQCPYGWLCDGLNGDCLDPAALGACLYDDDCIGRPGCAGGCECFDGACRVSAACSADPAGDLVCGSGRYCAGGFCQPAVACPGGQVTCTPYGLVCRSGYCGNPALCGVAPAYTCEGGDVCLTHFNPPRCFPPNTAGCVRDDQCPADAYCDLLTSACRVGCRGDADCAGLCGGSTPCYCRNLNLGTTGAPEWARECGATAPAGVGDGCSEHTDCLAGSFCSVADGGLIAICFGVPSTSGCETRTCHESCDLTLNLVTTTCPATQSCDGTNSTSLRLLYLAGSTSPDISLCYPD
jgi:hypothetical protein